MTDYTALIDAETWAFIRETEAHCPPPRGEFDVAVQRARYDAMCAAVDGQRPDGVKVTDSHAETVPIRIYATADPAATVLYLHGGGFVLGSLDSHDSACADICARSECRVVSVGYRLAPEHKDTAAYDDALASARWALFRYGSPLILCGDSAGATLAASVAHAMRQNVAGQVLIYPYLGGDMNTGSYLTHANAPMLSREDMLFFEGVRTDGGLPEGDVRYAPLAETDFKGLPPTAVFTAECDPLCDDGQHYVDQLVAAGAKATCVKEPGLVHGYLRARHTVGRARDGFTRIVEAVKKLANPSD